MEFNESIATHNFMLKNKIPQLFKKLVFPTIKHNRLDITTRYPFQIMSTKGLVHYPQTIFVGCSEKDNCQIFRGYEKNVSFNKSHNISPRVVDQEPYRKLFEIVNKYSFIQHLFFIDGNNCFIQFYVFIHSTRKFRKN